MMNEQRNRVAWSVAMLVACAPSLVSAAGETKTYTHQLNTTCQGVNSYQNWDNMCDAFYDTLNATSAFNADGQVISGGSRRALVDSDLVVNGADTTGLDDADVAMICAHGSDQGANGWRASMEVSWSNSCSLSRQHMSLGDSDLEELFMSSCNSMDKDDTGVWNDGANPTANGVHGTHGFHGIMYISSSEIDRYEDAADDALYVSISSGWLWNLYSDDWNGANTGTFDQCPVTVHWGETEASALNRLMNGTLVTSLADSANPRANWYARWGVRGCAPNNEVAW